MYLVAVGSIVANDAFNAFVSGQIGCVWFFMFVRSKRLMAPNPPADARKA